MSPLSIEFLGPKNEWVKIGEVESGGRPGTMSQNRPDGEREIYFLECKPDNSGSIISRSKAGVDIEMLGAREVYFVEKEIVATLKEGESYSMSVKTDGSNVRRVARFIHTKATK